MTRWEVIQPRLRRPANIAWLGVNVLLLAAWVTAARADPLDRRQLPQATLWFVHLDVDAAKASTLGNGFREVWIKHPEVAKAIAKARQATGMDPTREIQSLTLYGVGYAADQTVLIVRGKVNRPHLESLLKQLPDYRCETLGGHEVYFWTEKKADGGPGGPGRTGAFYGTSTIVISPSANTLVTALDVMAGTAPALSDGSPLAASGPANAILQVAVSGLAEAKALPIQSPILRKCESGRIAMGEREGVVFLNARVVTLSPEIAGQMKALMEGARAMAQLENPDETVNLLLQPLKITVDDKALNVAWEYSSTELVRIIEKASAARWPVAPPPRKDQ